MINLPFDPQDHRTPKRSGKWADGFRPVPDVVQIGIGARERKMGRI
jgi:hypothetical protein